MRSTYVGSIGKPGTFYIYAGVAGVRKVITIVCSEDNWFCMDAKGARKLIAHIEDGLARIEAMIENDPPNIDDKEPS